MLIAPKPSACMGKKRDESISADSDGYRGCYYRGFASARAAISGQRGQRHRHAEGRKRYEALIYVVKIRRIAEASA